MIMRLRSSQSILLIGAIGFFVVTGCWIVLDLALRGALAPGSGDLRDAVLRTLVDMPVLLCLVAGAICTLASGAAFLHHLLASKKSA
jgi:hypothetical protein